MGMIIDSVNGMDCTSLSSAQVASVLRDLEYEVSLRVFLPEARPVHPSATPTLEQTLGPTNSLSTLAVSTFKPTADTRMGVTFKNLHSTTQQGVYVSELDEHGILASTLLRTGVIVDSINGVDLTYESSSYAADILRNAVGEITFVAHFGSYVPQRTLESGSGVIVVEAELVSV